jgi:hypothetical protein
MPIVYRRVYFLTFSGDPDLKMVAFGVYPRKIHPGTRELPGFFFATDSNVPGTCGHLIEGLVTKDGGDVVEVTESERVQPDGSHRVWRFTPMTRDLWLSLPGSPLERAHVEALAKVFVTDESVQNFLLDEHLDEVRYPGPPGY